MDATLELEYVAPYGEITETLDPPAMPPMMTRIHEAAMEQCDADGCLSFDGLAESLGVDESNFYKSIEELTRRGIWPYLDSGPLPHQEHRMPDAAEMMKIRAEACEAVTRPKYRHAPGRPPEPTAAEACRGYLREWRRMRKRRRLFQIAAESGLYRNAPTITGYLGIQVEGGLYRAIYWESGRAICGQRFTSLEDAARCHDAMALARGETVRLNSNPDPSVKHRRYRLVKG